MEKLAASNHGDRSGKLKREKYRPRVVCQTVARELGLKTSGRRNALGSIAGRRRCEWFAQQGCGRPIYIVKYWFFGTQVRQINNPQQHYLKIVVWGPGNNPDR